MTADKRVLILGAGTMGRGIALCFAKNGYETNLYDPDSAALKQARVRITADLDLLVEMGRMTESRKAAVFSRIHSATGLPRPVPDLLLEAAPEELHLKRALFRELEKEAAPTALFCTNTSALSITLLSEEMKHPERLVGTHFWNPPHLVPCVEVVPGDATTEAYINRAMAVLREIERRPVRIRRDLPGFVGNRLQHALFREALFLVESGVVSPEDLDEVVRYGFGLRMPLMGPMERADLGGLDVTGNVQRYLLPHLSRNTDASSLLTGLAAKGRLGLKTGGGFFEWDDKRTQKTVRHRDRALLQLLSLMETYDRD